MFDCQGESNNAETYIVALLRRANQLRHGDDLMMGGEFFAFMFQRYHAPIRLTTMGSVECTVRGISPQTELMSGEETIV
ncbi:hypothetical protein N7541_000385 [Penicillium brevicompactum]|uniref:Uncharacterized protein n=1 Tax=Penicillium brevicompactum TaxID=5074 RepID=A0A9W9V3L1_PENBR|nr:hypothetical protein N7541_000385 [Penicillium brevicompactum]